MKAIQWTLTYAITITVLIVLEGMLTLGVAFQFEKYNWIAWVLQILAVIIALCVGTIVGNEEINGKKPKPLKYNDFKYGR